MPLVGGIRWLKHNTENASSPIDFELWSSSVCAFSTVLVSGGGCRDFIKVLGKGLAI